MDKRIDPAARILKAFYFLNPLMDENVIRYQRSSKSFMDYQAKDYIVVDILGSV